MRVHQEVSRDVDIDTGLYTFTCHCGWYISSENIEDAEFLLNKHIEEKDE